MTQLPAQNPFPVNNRYVPCKGPKTIPVLIDFSLGTLFQLDLTQIQFNGYIENVQTIFIDNSKASVPFSVLMSVDQQTVTIGPGKQGYIPILQPNPPVLQFSSTSNIKIVIQLLNFYVPPGVWDAGVVAAATVNVADVVLDATVSNNRVNVTTLPADIPLTDDSSTIAVGGTVQQAIAANAARKRFIIHNPSTATEILQMCFGVSTAGRIDLLAGMTWDESGTTEASGAVFVVAATGGHAYTAYEG